MSRGRFIKPGFFTNDDLAEIAPLGRLLFIGLWCQADREGRLEDRPKKLKAEILPYDSANVDTLLNDLQARGFILRYEVDGCRLIRVNPNDLMSRRSGEWKTSPERLAFQRSRPRLFAALLVRDGTTCRNCGDTRNLTVDHVVPISRGGSSELDNLQILCNLCNSRKGARA